jgi:hypothetical protein
LPGRAMSFWMVVRDWKAASEAAALQSASRDVCGAANIHI